MELRNEINAGEEIIFVLPKIVDGVRVKIERVINATNCMKQQKMSAGQHNAIKIPREWFPAEYIDKISPYILAYKRK